MVNGKKGGASWGGVIVVGLIILLVSTIVFAPLVNLVVGFFKSGGSASLCTLSLFEGKGIARCPIDDVIISKDEVRIRYGGKEYKSKDEYDILVEKESTIANMANEALAKLLNDCLQRGGGLNSRAFARSGWWDKDIVCMECAQITISEDVRGATATGTITGLAGYLNANKPKGGISDKKYIELLTKNEQHRKVYMKFGEVTGLTPPDASFEFVPGNDYTAFFVGIKKGTADRWWGRFTAFLRGDFIDAVIGKSDTYYAYIAKPSELGKVCEKKVN